MPIWYLRLAFPQPQVVSWLFLRHKHKGGRIHYPLSKSESEKSPMAKMLANTWGYTLRLLILLFKSWKSLLMISKDTRKRKREPPRSTLRFSQKCDFGSNPSKGVTGVAGPHSQTSFMLSGNFFFFHLCSIQAPGRKQMAIQTAQFGKSLPKVCEGCWKVRDKACPTLVTDKPPPLGWGSPRGREL